MNGLLWNVKMKKEYKETMFELVGVQLCDVGISYQLYTQDEEALEYVFLLHLTDEHELLSFVRSKTYIFIEQLFAKLCSFQTIELCAI